MSTVALESLLDLPVPDGFTVAPRMRHDRVANVTFRKVTLAPEGVDPETFGFGTSGAYAWIDLNEDGSAYRVGIFATKVASYLQSAGRVREYDSPEAAMAQATGFLRCELEDQARGW